MLKNRITAFLAAFTFIFTALGFEQRVSAEEETALVDGKIILLDLGNPDNIPENAYSNNASDVSDEIVYEGKTSSLMYTMKKSGTADLDIVINTEETDLSKYNTEGTTINIRLCGDAPESQINLQYFKTGAFNGNYYPVPSDSTRPVATGDWQVFSLPFSEVYAKTGDTISLRINDNSWSNNTNYSNGDAFYFDSIWIGMADYGSKTLAEPTTVITNGDEYLDTSLEGSNNFTLTFSEELWGSDYIENDVVMNVADGVSVYEYNKETKEYILTEQSYSVLVNGNVLEVVFDEELADKIIYKIEINSEYILSGFGKKLASDISYVFGVGTGSFVFRVTDISVENGALVDEIVDYKITFNHELDEGLYVPDYIKVYCNGERVYNAFDASAEANVLTLTFIKEIIPGSTYTVKIEDTYTDIDGNYIWGDSEFEFSVNEAEAVSDTLVIFSAGNAEDMNTLNSPLAATDENTHMYERTTKLSIPAYVDSNSGRAAWFSNMKRFDTTGMNYVNLWVSCLPAGVKGTANIVMYMSKADNKYNLYRHTLIGSDSWQLITIPITDITSETSFDLFSLSFNTWVSATTTWPEPADVYVDAVWFSKEEPKMLDFVSSSFPDKYNNAELSGQILKLNFSTELANEQSPQIVIKDENGNTCEDYEVSYSKDTMTIVFGELLPSTEYSLSVDSLMAKQPVRQSEPVNMTFTTVAGGVYLNDIVKNADSVSFDIDASAESELQFVIYAVGEDNVLLEKVSQTQTVSGQSEVKVDFVAPSGVKDIKAFVLDKKGRFISNKYASLASDAAEFTVVSQMGDNQQSIETDAKISSNLLELKASLYGVNDSAIVEIAAPDGEVVSADVVKVDSNNSFVYYYVFPDTLKSGVYTANISSGMTKASESIGYLSKADRDTFMSLANSSESVNLTSFIISNTKNLNIDTVSDGFASDMAARIIEKEQYKSYAVLYEFTGKMPLILNDINTALWGDITKIINEHGELIGGKGNETVRYFTSLSEIAQNNISAKLAGKLPASSFTELLSKLGLAKDEYEASIKTNNNTGSSGSGGGGGGGTGIKTASGSVSNASTSTQPIETNTVFNDLGDVEWAKGSVMKLYEEGIVSAAENKKFRPNDNITREEFIKLVVCAFTKDTTAMKNSFTDAVEGAWYNEYLDKAVALGITDGYPDGRFGIGENITREDMVTLIARAVEIMGKSLKPGSADSFTDSELISDYAYEYVGAMTKLGVINGMDDGSFAPKATATRAQAAKVIASLID